MAHPALRDPALRAFADLLLAFEDDGADLAVAFRKLDTDRSGAVDARQLRSGLKSLGKTFAHFSDDDARRVVKALDKDNSGDLDLVELRKFVRLAREARDGPQEVDSEDADHLGDLLISFEDQGGDVDGFIARLDRNGDGRVTGNELYRGLRGLGEVFDSLDKKHARALVRSLDADDSGGIDARELRSFVDNHRKKNGGQMIKKGDAPDLVREKLRALLLRTEQKGTSLSSVFHALDEDDSGALSVNELLSGLSKLGIFDSLDKRDVQDLVQRDLDSDRNGNVSIKEFLAFCRNSKAPSSRTVEKGGDDEDLDLVAQTYEFSSDPDVRAIEKKLRRAAREVAARGGDVRLLASQYDRDNSGSIVRSDFVQFLMQLGLSLVDAGGVPKDTRREAGDALRERQLRQLARVRGGAAPSRARRLLKGPTPDSNLTDEWDELALTQWYREGAKKEMVRGMLAKSMLSAVQIYPRFGTTCWFEVELTNPFGQAERFAVDVPKGEKELRVVTSAEEWQHLRRNVPVAFGTVGQGAVEADMIDGSGPPGAPPMVLLMARETVRIPFAFLSLTPPSHDLRWGRDDDKEDDARTVPVRFVAAGGFVVAATEVTARQRACVVDRTFRFYQAEGEILKRCVRVMPNAPAPLEDLGALGGWAAQAGAPRATDDRSMYVHCVGTGRGDASDVSIQWRESQDCPGAHEVLLKYARVGAFPSVGEFFVLVFRDRFCARLAEMWHVVVHSRLRADLAGVAGQAAGVELVVRGDRTPRVVRAYAAPAGGASIGDATFDPPQDFRLVPHAHNKFAVHYRAREGGAARVHVHLVDTDTHELVAAWLMTAVSSQPTITKTYDVELSLGKAATKRIPYRNPWNRPKSFGLVSSDENVLRPRDGNARVTIPPNGVEYLRLYFPAVHRRGMLQCLLYVNSEHDQSEEVFLLRLLVA
jgi:Ca2+-binding EF-hand superfamily protein